MPRKGQSPGIVHGKLATKSRQMTGNPSQGETSEGRSYTTVVNLNACIDSLNLISVGDRAMVIKTWLNGWATTNRIKGEFARDCLLGCCGEPDSLNHYLRCPRMYACQLHVIPRTSEDPLIRCGLACPDRINLAATACTFSAYHALKGRINHEFEGCIPPHTDMTSYWIFFAQSFATAAGECSLTRTLFNPSSFLNSF